jgi:hypothetical protein
MVHNYRLIERHADNVDWPQIRMKAGYATARSLGRRLLGLTLCATSVVLMHTINDVLALPSIADISASQVARMTGALAVGWLGATLFARCKRS